MFGHIMANTNDLTDEERDRYRAIYCGLCDVLKKKFGTASRFCLSYDLTFVVLLLSSLNEPIEESQKRRCIGHPFKKVTHTANSYTEYAADLTVALTYYKCLDDWQDDHNRIKKRYAKLLEPHYAKIKERLPRQCEVIEKELACIYEIEASENPTPDAAVNAFGRLMAELLVAQDNYWNSYLYRIGYGLGRYIYMADAAVDLNEDIKKGSYNPLTVLNKTPEEMRPFLMQMLGDASDSFEALPIVQDIGILKNILYSGIWMKYNKGVQTERKKTNGK